MSKKPEHTFCFKLTARGFAIVRAMRQTGGILPNEILMLTWMEDGNYYPMAKLEEKTKGEFYNPSFAECIVKLVKEKAIEELK